MILEKMKIKNFRNYDSLEITLSPGINILYGKNGQGKTNLLESIYVLGLTKSHRSFIDNNLIKKNEVMSKIEGKIVKNSLSTTLKIILNKSSKKLNIDHKEIQKVSDYISIMNIIIFYPEDLELVKSSPVVRRRFLNVEISQIDGSYLELMNQYNKILKIRNTYLKNPKNKEYLSVITDHLIDIAASIYIIRKKFVDRINEYIESIFFNLSNISNFQLSYKTSISINDFHKNHIKELLNHRFLEIYDQELKYKATLIGPHKDDLEFLIKEENIKNYGSQGQQRMAVLAIKLSEIQILKKYKQENPILLLDDVFSELDDERKNSLLNYIHGEIQTIITTTDLKNINKNILKTAKIFHIQEGKIIEKGE